MKSRYALGITILFIIGSIIFGVTYIPEKPCDSLTDVEEIGNYIVDYMVNYVPSNDEKMNELMRTIGSVSPHPQWNDVWVCIKDCTFVKKQLFKREIINSPYIKFMEWGSGSVHD